MGRRGKRNDYTADFEQLDTPAQVERRNMRRSRHIWPMATIIIAGVIISPISLAMSVRSVGIMNNASREVSAYVKTVGEDKPGRSIATQAVIDYLTGENTPFPAGVADIQWENARKLRTDASTDSGKGDTDWWSHSFTFTDTATKTTRGATQLVSVTSGTATATGTPTLMPVNPGDSVSSEPGAPQGYKTLEQSQTLTDMLAMWAKAYVGDDTSALTVLVADPNQQHAYQPAGLGEYTGVSMNWAVRKDIGGTEYGVVSVTVRFTPNGRAKDDDGTTQPKSSTTLCLLVADPSSGGARVVAWGPNGDVESLRPYGNAADKSKVSSSQSGTSKETAGSESGGGEASQTGTGGQDGQSDGAGATKEGQ